MQCINGLPDRSARRTRPGRTGPLPRVTCTRTTARPFPCLVPDTGKCAPVLVRTADGVHLTPEGQRWYGWALTFDAGRLDATSASQQSHTLRAGNVRRVTPTGATPMLALGCTTESPASRPVIAARGRGHEAAAAISAFRRQRISASRKASMSPSSTAPVLPVSTSVRRSLTIWYGCST